MIANQDRGIPYVGILSGALQVHWTYVLLPAGTVDSISRRGRARSGRA
jgi:hypothetical protein